MPNPKIQIMAKKVKDIEKLEAKVDCIVDQVADLAALMLQLLINQDRFGGEITKSLTSFKQELSTFGNNLADLEERTNRRFSHIEQQSENASRLIKVIEALVNLPYLAKGDRIEVNIPSLEATEPKKIN
ncbi:hypothetical protein V2H45_12640 [Tumidithrix elongata RA019]|uniref:Uncharacterized protein n=1 Tax=Tumidithrix elongata BACA0141 TaxID=2716417 RepID=A0AAW9Q099_9CYAN|nr:hypothetical protein [Tumidithrix elongata RA019]